MLPSVAAYATVARKIVAYTVVVVALTVVFGVVAELGAVYHVSAGVLGAAFLWLAVKVQRTESPAMAMRLFTYSITYITLLFGAMAADVLVRFGA